MKTATEWANRIQNSKEPWAKLVEEIQREAVASTIEELIKNFEESGELANNVGENGISNIYRECAEECRKLAKKEVG